MEVQQRQESNLAVETQKHQVLLPDQNGREIPILPDQSELSGVRQGVTQMQVGSERISGLLKQRQAGYRNEIKVCRERINQDALLVSSFEDIWHVGVADGIGSLEKSEVAATQTLRYLHRYLLGLFRLDLWPSQDPAEMRAYLRSILRSANNHLNRWPLSLMGATTVVGAFPVSAQAVLVYSVGDSGAALVPADPGGPILYNALHTTFEEAIEKRRTNRQLALYQKSVPNPEESINEPERVTAALGGGVRGPQAVFLSLLTVRPGDTLFLFSDGLLKTVGKLDPRKAFLAKQNLRRTEYGRADRLLQFLSDPCVEIAILADAAFRAQEGGPELLLDDLAVVRVEIGANCAKPFRRAETEVQRPASQTMQELDDEKTVPRKILIPEPTI